MNNLKLNKNSSPAVIQYTIKELKLKQIDIAKALGVTPACVSMAINNKPYTGIIRKQIIEFLRGRK